MIQKFEEEKGWMKCIYGKFLKPREFMVSMVGHLSLFSLAFHYHKIFKLDVLDCWYSKTKKDYLLGYDTHFPCNRIFRKVII